jgi:hypothetical protein
VTDHVEILDKIDAALGIVPKDKDEATAYPIIRELRDRHVDSLHRLIMQEKEKAEIDMKSFLLIKSLAEQVYSEKATMEITLTIITVREQLRKITNLPTLTSVARSQAFR